MLPLATSFFLKISISNFFIIVSATAVLCHVACCDAAVTNKFFSVSPYETCNELVRLLFSIGQKKLIPHKFTLVNTLKDVKNPST